MLKTYFISVIFLFAAFSSFAQTNAPKYSNEFLSIGIGARALAMGRVSTAISTDVTAAYWNPAGLLGIEHRYDIGLMHAEYFAGIAKYDYMGFATRLDESSVLALSVIRFGVDDIPDTRFLYDANGAINYNNIRYFSAADYAFLISYARKSNLIEGLQTGASFKIVHRIVGQFASAWGFGLDAGARYEKNGWMLGAMARDVTNTFNAWSHNTDMVRDVYLQTGNEIPQNSLEITLPKLILGVGRAFLIKEKFGVLASADLITTFDGKRNTVVKSDLVSIEPAAGVELDYKKIVFLRAGVGNFQQVQDFEKNYTSFQPNFGIGVKINRFALDYALTDLGNTSEALYSNIFSLRISLN